MVKAKLVGLEINEKNQNIKNSNIIPMELRAFRKSRTQMWIGREKF